MDLDLTTPIDLGLAATVDLLNRAFADYLVPISFTEASFLHMVGYDNIDLAASRVVLRAGTPVGAGLIARRGWTSRLAGMALVPEAREQGAGRWTMERLIEEAHERGERTMVLEVIDTNAHARALYRACGFSVRRRLVGYTLSSAEDLARADADLKDANLRAVALVEVDPHDVARVVIAHGLPNLPWQVSGESLAQLGAPNCAYRMGDAYAVISNPDAPHVGLRALIVRPEGRRQGQAARLIRALVARHAGAVWHVPALCPEEMAPLFEGLGFVRDALGQVQMRRHL